MATAYVTKGDTEGEYIAEIPVSGRTQPSFDYIRPNLEVRSHFRSRGDIDRSRFTTQYFVALVGLTSSSNYEQFTVLAYQRVEIRCLNDATTRCPPRSIIPSDARLPKDPMVEGWLKLDALSWAGLLMGGELPF
jgi:hypothetical protein